MGVKQFVFVSFSVLVCCLLLIVITDGPPSNWRFDSVGDQSGKVVICTGANSGTGFHFSRHMAAHGANVVMACRSNERCNAAVKSIRKEFPNALVHAFELDLSSLKSISQFVDKFKSQFNRLDILMNNAGVMGLQFNETVDHFETHIGVNHLGHFALTGLLFPLISATSSLPNPNTGALLPPRIITVSSIMEKFALFLPSTMDPNDLHFAHRPYNPPQAYMASKIANIYFFKELHRRIRADGSKVLSVGVHPGFSRTALQEKDDMLRDILWLVDLVGQSGEMGAAPLVFAATSAEVESGEYYGPGSAYGLWGWPKRSYVLHQHLDPREHAKLWEKSIELTKVKPYPSNKH